MGKILLVDDEPDMLEVWMLFLRPSGHEVKKAYNGEEALTVAQTFLPDLMILDLMMPGVSGEEVLKRAKDIEVMKNVRIVVVSAHTKGEQLAQDLGADGFLAKPVHLDQFQATVKKFLG